MDWLRKNSTYDLLVQRAVANPLVPADDEGVAVQRERNNAADVKEEEVVGMSEGS